MTTLRLGTASPSPGTTTAASLALVAALARRAASLGVDLLLLPEAFLGGEVLEGVARETGVFLVVGCVERAGGSLYCAAVYVCPREGIVGKRRKVMPTASERLVWAQGCPSSLRAVTTTLRGVRVNMAAAICWESYMPLLRQALYAQNINLYLAPTADARDAWLALVRTVGVEGRCFVVSSNMCVAEPQARKAAEPPTGHRRRKSIVHDPDGNEIVLCCEDDGHQAGEAGEAGEARQSRYASRGGSCIVSPFGDVLAGPQWEDDEAIIFADVDMRDCIRGRLDLDTAGSYSRGDAFKLTVQGLDLDPLPY
ncbi:hypothetical protein HIM_06223 [Hirsutella minnesotensis 3608]|uniref:CN hydrolase domain-containing protein n=1 Tax=Hirsutella minnesotensis 3608 TaxID=1043627 RepID=A0A0F7ZU83_9HYPO|nr:hypothetical protein HIM_06223 [Hirsutella minnesotensis 3608]